MYKQAQHHDQRKKKDTNIYMQTNAQTEFKNRTLNESSRKVKKRIN